MSPGGSARSGGVTNDRERLNIARRKLQVRRKLLQVDVPAGLAPDVGKEADVVPNVGVSEGVLIQTDEEVPGTSAPPQEQGTYLQVPNFVPSGALSSSASLMGIRTPAQRRVAELQQQDKNLHDRRVIKEELLLQLEELEIEEAELLVSMREEEEERAMQSMRGPTSGRVLQWVDQQRTFGNGIDAQGGGVELGDVNELYGASAPHQAPVLQPTLIRKQSNTHTPTQIHLPPSSNVGSVGSTNMSGMTPEQAARRIGGIPKLPTLTGARAEWISFLTQYKSTTDDYGLTPAENLRRLQESIKGDALALLHGSLLLPSQVDAAIKRLEMFYGTPQRLLGEAEDILFNLPQLAPDLSNLALYAGEVTYTMAVIDLAKESERNFTLLRMLERKFTPDFGMSWAKRKMKEEPTLRVMEAFLNEKLTFAVEANINVTVVHNTPKKKQTVLGTFNQQPMNKPGTDMSPAPCEFGCETVHPWSGCSGFLALTPVQRKMECRNHRKCFRCLLSHPFGKCKSKGCSVAACGQNHHALLHGSDPDPVLLTRQDTAPAVLFRVVQARVSYGDKEVDSYALLDTGAAISMIHPDLVQALSVPGVFETLNVCGTDNHGRELWAKRVRLSILDNKKEWRALSCYGVPDLSLPEQTYSAELLEELEITVDVPVFHRAKPLILIGLDNGHLLRTLECQPSCEERISAVKTPLGWMLEGCVQANTAVRPVLLTQLQQLDRKVQEYINADTFGMIEDDGPPRSI